MNKIAIILTILGLSSLSLTADAGRLPFAYVDHDVLMPGQFVRYYNQVFEAQHLAMVGVVGDGDGDIDCVVLDAGGNVVTSDSDFQDGCVLSWVPAWTGQFQIIATNNGRVSSAYVIRTN
jgi:predicted nuclease of predicted toxin-antitoxin system